MIQHLTIKKFKGIENQTYDFQHFNLLVGRNNSGKSTILQAMAIWQYCVDEFERSDIKGKTGIQIILSDFTALPLPEFNLMWYQRTDRKSVKNDEGKPKPDYILIEIALKWIKDGVEHEFAAQLRYQSPQSIHAMPVGGPKKFKDFLENKYFPKIVYVPPFSGLETKEIRLDDGNIKEQIGKAQPGSILRNLVLKVSQNKENWGKFNQNLKEWFGLELQIPAYDGSKNTSIICNYFMSSTQLKTSKSKSKTYEIIVAGSGFHQILILLSFYYGYDGLTTLLFDEPDAHLHNNLQRMVLNFFEAQEQVQFIVATHAPAMIQATNIANIISILDKKPTKIKNTTDILTAFTDVDNIEILHCQSNPYILYVEGNDDERILKNWANTLGLHNIFNNFFVYKMGGGNKKEMSQNAKKHFLGLKKFVPDVKRIILFDYDSEEESIPTNEVIYEWKRKNIDNYLLVQSAWHRVIGNKTGQVFSIDTMNETKIIDDFFENERLNLNKSENYRTIDANVFKMTDGKKMLFESKDSLFNQLKKANTNLTINRDTISRAMTQEELHQDIIDFFEKMTDLHNIEPEKSL